MSRRVWASASWFVVLLVPVRGISPLAIYPPNPNGASPPHLGRTTFVNTLCGKHVLSHKDADDAANAHIEEGVKIKPVTVGMESLELFAPFVCLVGLAC